MNKDPKPHILVVDDDAKIRLLLRRCFEGEGYRVSEAANGPEALERVAAAPLDLVTLDLGLPGEDGFTVGRAIRARSWVPIVMVTGKGDVVDRVVGLELGADDYITKPFHIREVLARVRAVLRRSEATRPSASGEVLAFGDWVLDVPRRELRSPSGACDLTTSEFDLLHVFVTHPQRPLTRDQIMDLLRGRDWAPLDRSIDNLVVRLRRKVEPDPERPTLIKTVRGVGYTFAGNVRSAS
jgi:DNA-binding response OmpR family regulator